MSPAEWGIEPEAWRPKDVSQELRGRARETRDRLDERSTTGFSYKHFTKMLNNRIYIMAVLDDPARDEQEVRDKFKN